MTDEKTENERVVRRELERLRGFVTGLSLEDVRSGDWFAKLLTFSLGRYTAQVDADYFRKKYPHLPPDAIAAARIDLAAKYAGIEGALSASAYTGAVAATIGSAGGASPVALPAGLTSFVVDLTYVSQLQLRLAYDLAVIYGVPLDTDDPEELWKLIKIAFGVKAAETGGNALMKGVPAVVRPVVKKVFSGSTLTAVRSLPVVGRYLLQRNLIKFAIPAVGVPLTTGVNFWTTKVAGRQALKTFRTEARIIEEAGRAVAGTEHHELLLWVGWLAAVADGQVTERQRALLHHVSVGVVERGLSTELIDQFRGTVEVDRAAIWAKLAAAGDSLESVYGMAKLVAVIDGKVSGTERELLAQIAGRCGVTFDPLVVRKVAKSWE
ncbi:hypothetical protein [Mariniluteicoccus flavus]